MKADGHQNETKRLTSSSSSFQALVKKNQDLTPSQAEQTALSNLVTKIQTVLDGLIVSPGSFDACVSPPSIFFLAGLASYVNDFDEA